MIKKLILFIAILICHSMGFATSQYIVSLSVNSKSMKDVLKLVDSSTLVMISVNNVIIAPKTKMLIKRPSNPYSAFIDDLAKKTPSNKYLKIPVLEFLNKKQDKLLEPEWVDFISELKKKEANIFGFYQTYPYVVQYLQNLETKIYQELKDMNIEFTNQVMATNVLTILKGNVDARFYNGILFTGTCSKQETFYEFLRVTNINPKKIIIIDSEIDVIKQIYAPLKPLDFHFYGIYYVKIYNMEERPDPRVALLQQETLLSKSIWLEDEEAEKLLKDQATNGSAN